MSVALFNANGVKSDTTIRLPKELFAVEIKNHQLLKDAYLSFMANGRANYAKTLKRGEVSGGGRKPWRQKGTGRARFGSSRNPIWRGGGVAFGPSGNENYTRKISIQAKHQALAQALTLASSDKLLVIIEDFIVKDGKTKTAVSLIKKIGIDQNCLIVAAENTKETIQSLKNLPEIKLIKANVVSAHDVLNARQLVITKAALAELQKRCGGKQS